MPKTTQQADTVVDHYITLIDRVLQDTPQHSRSLRRSSRRMPRCNSETRSR